MWKEKTRIDKPWNVFAKNAPEEVSVASDFYICLYLFTGWLSALFSSCRKTLPSCQKNQVRSSGLISRSVVLYLYLVISCPALKTSLGCQRNQVRNRGLIFRSSADLVAMCSISHRGQMNNLFGLRGWWGDSSESENAEDITQDITTRSLSGHHFCFCKVSICCLRGCLMWECWIRTWSIHLAWNDRKHGLQYWIIFVLELGSISTGAQTWPVAFTLHHTSCQLNARAAFPVIYLQ